MSKMLIIALNGGKEPTNSSKDLSKFIKDCANLGILAGTGDGTFAPDSTVTGAQAAKMLLVALGYESNDPLNSNINDYCLTQDKEGKYCIAVGGVEIAPKNSYASPVNIEMSAIIPSNISTLLDMDNAEVVHVIAGKSFETLKPEVNTEKSDKGTIMMGRVIAETCSPFIMLVPFKAEYSEIIDAAVKSIEKEDGVVSENPTTGVESNIFIFAVTGLCSLAVALKLGVKRED